MRGLGGLLDREKELQLVTDTMSVGVARISRNFTYLWVNRVYAQWVGRNPSEIIGREDVVGGLGLLQA